MASVQVGFRTVPEDAGGRARIQSGFPGLRQNGEKPGAGVDRPVSIRLESPRAAARQGGVYRNLDPDEIVRTVGRLKERVEQRFPGSGLAAVAMELHHVALDVVARTESINRPHLLLRTCSTLTVAGFAGALAAVLYRLRLDPGEWTWLSVIQVLESAINDVVLLGAGLFFLMTLETRIKRRRAIKAIHELRSLAHIIDMHQLTKDPHVLLDEGPRTAASPERTLSRFQLARYLDYCSEMLSLLGKLAALYVQRFDDPVALAAVDGVEDLTTGLSRKIWQKIAVLERA